MREIEYSSHFSSIFKAALKARVDGNSLLKNKTETSTSLFNSDKLDIDEFASKEIYYAYTQKYGDIKWLKSSNFNFFKYQINLVFRSKNIDKFRLIENVINESLLHGLTFVLNKASSTSQKFHSYYRSVNADIHANKGFCRLKPAEDYLLGEINTEHHTGDILVNFFNKRFPNKKIALFDRTKKVVFIYDLKDTYITKDTIFQENFDQISDGDIYSAYWQTYYESQYIPEKKNLKLALQHFPKKRWYNMFEAIFLKEKLEE